MVVPIGMPYQVISATRRRMLASVTSGGAELLPADARKQGTQH